MIVMGFGAEMHTKAITIMSGAWSVPDVAA
jgi:hypothetical protein